MFLAQPAHGISNESLRDQVIAHHISRPSRAVVVGTEFPRLKPGLCFLGPSGRIPNLRRQLLSVSLNQAFFNSLLGSQLLFDSAIKPAQVLTKGQGRI